METASSSTSRQDPVLVLKNSIEQLFANVAQLITTISNNLGSSTLNTQNINRELDNLIVKVEGIIQNSGISENIRQGKKLSEYPGLLYNKLKTKNNGD